VNFIILPASSGQLGQCPGLMSSDVLKVAGFMFLHINYISVLLCCIFDLINVFCIYDLLVTAIFMLARNGSLLTVYCTDLNHMCT